MTTIVVDATLEFIRDNTWAQYAGWIDDDKVKELFEHRYGYAPEYVIRMMTTGTMQHGKLFAGPVIGNMKGGDYD